MSYTKFISELDTGLYDAMNKGLKMAKENSSFFKCWWCIFWIKSLKSN